MTDFYDKVLGCWLGKCLGGNVGAPFEGMKQRVSLTYAPEFVRDILPNDDLDLQILWLDLMEEKGLSVTAFDLAKSFAENCPYAPGEYAYFMKNFNKGIMPPLSGKFNNEFYTEGMGAPIRSEIWACLFHNSLDLAKKYAIMDASIDHCEDKDAINGELFLTVLEILCFDGGEPFDLVQRALEHLPDTSVLKAELRDILIWCKQSNDAADIQKRIVRKYGHSESCMAKQNIGFLITAFLLHGENFVDAILEAISFGYDTDCTGATLGAILGIFMGGKKLQSLFGITDTEYKLGVKSSRTDLTVSALTDSVVRLSRKLENEKSPEYVWSVVQTGNPCISFGETNKEIRLQVVLPETTDLKIKIQSPAVLSTDTYRVERGLNEIVVSVSLPDCDLLEEGIPASVLAGGVEIGKFGLSVRRRWRVYGPYWKNETVIPPLPLGVKYSSFLKGELLDEKMDHKRLFHLSCLPDENLEGGIGSLVNEYYDVVDTEEDIIDLDKHTGYRGNAVYYFETDFYAEDDEITGIQIGRNVPIQVWLNGEFLAEKDENETFYYETIHKLSVKLKKGKNTLLFKLVNNTEHARFSYNFLTNGVCSKHKSYRALNVRKDI